MRDDGSAPRDPLPPSVVTMGEPAGIGPEITLRSWHRLRSCPEQAFFVVGDPWVYRRTVQTSRIDTPIAAIDDPGEVPRVFPRALPVLARGFPKIAFRPGRPDPAYQKDVIESIRRGVEIARRRQGPLITNPIHKASWHAAGFDYPGHTEWIGAICGAERAVMMLAHSRLRVVPVTTHIPLEDVPRRLDPRAIAESITITIRALRTDFGIARPRIAVAALNPHAGELGRMGSQETAIITPAIERARQTPEGAAAEIVGPRPADTLFHDAARADSDAVICMYHDQALIPLKTLDFRSSVNITLGLDIVRTSPGHGTACDIAGRRRADGDSLAAAILQGQRIAQRRYHHALEG